MLKPVTNSILNNLYGVLQTESNAIKTYQISLHNFMFLLYYLNIHGFIRETIL